MDTKETGPQTRVLFFYDPRGNAAVAVVFQVVKKKGGKIAIKILDASDAVTADGRVAPTNMRGDEIEVTVVD